jgi:hypothetical protein
MTSSGDRELIQVDRHHLQQLRQEARRWRLRYLSARQQLEAGGLQYREVEMLAPSAPTHQADSSRR